MTNNIMIICFLLINVTEFQERDIKIFITIDYQCLTFNYQKSL